MWCASFEVASGLVAIGKVSPNYALDVVGSIYASDNIYTYESLYFTRNTYSYIVQQSGNLSFNTGSAGGADSRILLNANGNVSIGYFGDGGQKLYVAGNIVATGAITAGSASDMRLKENIVSMNRADAKSLIMALRPVTYRWNALATSLYDKYVGEDVGFVAQEVQPYMPVAISTIFEKYMRLDQTKFIAPLVSVAQDHELRIRELERENKELKEEIKRLRS